MNKIILCMVATISILSGCLPEKKAEIVRNPKATAIILKHDVNQCPSIAGSYYREY